LRQQHRLTFAGFGATPTPAFGGANPATTGGTGLFGGSGGGGAFGSTTGGGAFGGSSGFGSKTAFGTPATTTASTGLFGGGSTTATAPGTGFGSGGFGTTNVATSTPFGGGGSTSLFGGAKPAATGFGGAGTSGFGGGTTGGGLFGGGGATTGATGFGATANPGIGTNIGDPPGSAVVNFSPTVEKEPNNPSQSNSFQNLLFMDAYKKWSADELRLADYNQGRKTGGPGGTGAFGGSGFGGTSGFGTNTGGTGFGANTGTGMFGGGTQQPATGGFGATNTASTGGFGAGGGLFNKPAAGGMFGGTATTQPAQAGGGLFGGGGGGFGATNTATAGGFGATPASTGGGLFGGANAAAPKPAGFSFGNTGAATTGAGGFGAATSTPGFGATTANTGGGGLFGNTAQTNTAGGGLFGGQQQQQQQPQQAAGTGFGGGGFGAQAQNTGGGLFGNQQQKPGGLFGGATANTGTTGGGLFGNTNTGTAGGFGATTAAQPAGGLFGNKPAGTGGGLFGGGTTAQTGSTGGGLFGGLGGNTQAQQPAQGGSLFGGLGQNTQAKPSLFGGSTNIGGGGLFGNQPAQQQGGGLFGASTNQQQPQQGLMGNSLLGASQGQQMPQQAFNASIHDISAYGASTLFSGLPDDKIQNPGPLATPLSGKSKVKSRSILPMYKLSPANASRLATPQKRGYGFSYSAYGSPASPSSVSSTPGGFGQSLLAGSINRGLSKSVSASNLRRSFSVEDSILQPGAFSANSNMRLLGNAGNHKKLIINKEMRSDLFTSPSKEKQALEDANGSRKLAKRVSFDTNPVETPPDNRKAAIENGSTTDDVNYPKLSARPSTNGANGAKPSPVAATPEVEQVKGNELAVVHEEESPAAVRTEKKSGSTIEPGAYWMSPTTEEIRAMNRMQRQKVENFTVGRENVGSVAFRVPVDLSNTNLDELFDGIVVLIPRSATVYPVAAKKPPVGKGLNVPAIISLEHSYPRGGLATTGRRLERHIERLKTAIPDTTFESYDKETGVWTFSVEHFTTYGLGDDDDDDDDYETEVESVPARAPVTSPSIVKDSTSPIDPDDTFEFKRSRRAVPGAFDDAAMSDNEEASDAAQRQGTLSPEPQEADAPLPSREWPEDESMADGPDDYQLEAFEQSSQQGSVDDQYDPFLSRYADNETQVPAGIMRARLRAFKKSTAPTRIEVAGGDDWTQILQASVRAPRTVDRATLRALNESEAAWDMKDRGSPGPQKNVPVPDGPGFATSIDLMKSLFEQAKGPTQPVQASPAKGFVKVGVALAS
jgi:nuclear pore complex protein Nup98-Nup96